jgi:hypothetical protein
MSDNIENVKLKFACPANWDDMQDMGDAKFCNTCQKKVYDFTDSKADYFRQIMAESNYHACGRFTHAQTAVKPLLPVWKRWVSAALILIGINAWGCRDKEHSIGKALIKKEKADTIEHMLVGVPLLPPPVFPGGRDAFFRFVITNFDQRTIKKDGELMATFSIKKDGSVDNINIIHGLNAEANKEAIKVLKQSPRWEQPVIDNKPIGSGYSVMITAKAGHITVN